MNTVVTTVTASHNFGDIIPGSMDIPRSNLFIGPVAPSPQRRYAMSIHANNQDI